MPQSSNLSNKLNKQCNLGNNNILPLRFSLYAYIRSTSHRYPENEHLMIASGLLLNVRTLLSYEPNLLTLLVFVLSNIAYVLVMRWHFKRYIEEKRKRPGNYKLFRIYSAFFLSKVASRSERKFYVKCNIIGAVFGALIILSFATYLAKVFMH